MNIDYDNFDLAYESLINHVHKFDQSFITDQNIPKSEYYIDLYNLWIKAIMHSFSLKQIIDGTHLTIFNTQLHDYSSAYILARSLYESLLTMFYIFFDFKSDSEKEIKYNIWVYCGYFERQQYMVITADSIEKKQTEESILNSFKEKIISSPFYLNTPDARKKIENDVIKKGKWKLSSWNKIGKSLGLSPHIYKDIYSSLCGYAHSGRNSVFQLSQAANDTLRKELMIIPNSVLCVSIAYLLGLMYRIRNEFNKEYQIQLLPAEIEYYNYFIKVGREHFNSIDDV